MVTTMTRWLAVLVAMLTMGQGVFAQDGDSEAAELTRHCVAAMHDRSAETVDFIQAAAATGIAQIQRLDAMGAPDYEIIVAAHEAVEHVNGIAHRGSHSIDNIAARCIFVLRHMHADPRFIAIIREARGRSTEAIATSRSHAINAIQRALQEALDG